MDAHSANPRELRAYNYLGCTKNHNLINKYITRAFANNATVMNDDVYDAFTSMILGPAENYNFALDYFTGNIDKIRQQLVLFTNFRVWCKNIVGTYLFNFYISVSMREIPQTQFGVFAMNLFL